LSGRLQGPAPGVTDGVQVYNDAFAKIQAATGMSDMDKLVISFINAEDQNFSLFNYANELNQDLERLEEAVAELQGEWRALTGADANSEGQRQKVLDDLNTQTSELQTRSDAYETKFSSSTRKLDGLITGVSHSFANLECRKPEVEELGDRITENNLLAYLGSIEERANEILQFKSTLDTHKSQSDYKLAAKIQGTPVLGQGPVAGSGSSKVEVPYMPSTAQEHNSDGESDEEEVDDRPMSRDELQVKTMKNIGKKEKQFSKGKKKFVSN